MVACYVAGMSTAPRRPAHPGQQPPMRAEAPAAEPAAPVMGKVETGDPTAAFTRRSARPYKPFTFPADFAAEIMSGPDWRVSQFTEADMSFGLTTLTLEQELASHGRMVTDPLMYQLERSILMIGGRTGLDYTLIRDWLAAIGMKGRGAVGQLWASMNAPEAGVGKSMLETSGDWTT